MDNPSTFTDDRGTIRDLLVGDDYSVTFITFNPESVRGNHYHKATSQMDLILKGELLYSQDGNERIVKEGELIYIPEGVKHAYKAVEYSEMVSICKGVRIGTNYEKDTFKLVEPLL